MHRRVQRGVAQTGAERSAHDSKLTGAGQQRPSATVLALIGQEVCSIFLLSFEDAKLASAVSHSARPVHEVKANLFRVLGHPARVRILELLREGERSVGALQKELGLDSGGTSQHLAALRRIGLVESRREGTSVYYRVEDERVFDLLEAGRGIITRQLSEQQSILSELESS